MDWEFCHLFRSVSLAKGGELTEDLMEKMKRRDFWYDFALFLYAVLCNAETVTVDIAISCVEQCF